jgi:hypothetical protein
MTTGIPAFMQSRIRSAGSAQHGNFELLVLEGNQLVHYWRDNSKSDFRWYRAAVVSNQATESAWLIQNEAGGGQGNFEVVVPEGSNLVHYWRDNSNPNFVWHRGEVISNQATGPACLIQSDFRFGSGQQGNFEVMVPEGSNLVHYWRDNSKANAPWNRGEVISNRVTGQPSLIQSDFRFGSGEHGNLEVMVPEGNEIVHYWHDSSKPTSPWQRGEVISNQATGPACLIQSDFRFGSGQHGNFEMVVLEGYQLVHYWHDSSNMSSPWQRGEVICSQASGAGGLIQSDFRSGEHGNLEVVVPEGNELVHYWHDSANPTSPWQRSEVITSLR